jgi:hypothetical protein
MRHIPVKKIPFGALKGLYQGLDDNLINFSYSPDCQNVDVSEGIISTRKGSRSAYVVTTVAAGDIDALLSLGTTPFAAAIVSGNRKLYKLTTTWIGDTPSYLATVILHDVYPHATNSLKFINYAISSDAAIIIVDGTEPKKVVWSTGDGNYKMSNLGGTPPQGAYICLHRERVWIAGVTASPNTVYYSNAYDPEDWSTAGETGEINIETFDGDSITGVVTWLDDVFIFKNNTIWKVVGDTPGEYSVEQVYASSGLVFPNSICSDGNLCFFASYDGIYQYTGITAEPILTDAIKDAWSDIKSGGFVVCKIIDNKLYVINRSNGKSIVYDVLKKTVELWLLALLEDSSLTHVLNIGESLYYSVDNSVHEIYDKLKDGGTDIDMYWYTGITDFSYPNAVKFMTGLYFTGWGTTSAGVAGGQVKVTVYYYEDGTEYSESETITLQTERNLEYLQPMIQGRIFRIKFENVDGSAINLSGIEPVLEVSED